MVPIGHSLLVITAMPLLYRWVLVISSRYFVAVDCKQQVAFTSNGYLLPLATFPRTSGFLLAFAGCRLPPRVDALQVSRHHV